MSAGISGSDGKVHIYPEDTRTQLGNVHGAGDDFQKQWATSVQRISSPGKIGGGSMGRAFLAQYQKSAKSVQDMAAGIPGAYWSFADTDNQIVGKYEEAAAAAAQQFKS